MQTPPPPSWQTFATDVKLCVLRLNIFNRALNNSSFNNHGAHDSYKGWITNKYKTGYNRAYLISCWYSSYICETTVFSYNKSYISLYCDSQQFGYFCTTRDILDLNWTKQCNLEFY